LWQIRPDCVLHTAALTNIDHCEAHPAEAEKLNAEVPALLARAAHRTGVHLVYISTDAVFDGEKGFYDESSVPAPRNVYGRTKLLGESNVRNEHPSTCVVRTTIYGCNMQEKTSLGEWVVERLQRGDRVPGIMDVEFSPLATPALSRILLKLIETRAEGVFHASASDACSKYEFALRLADAFGCDASLVYPVKAVEVMRVPRARLATMDSSKLSKTLGFAMPSVADGLREFKMQYVEGYPVRLKSMWKEN
jgi:dTDP-4-dehydrorhamnose reductase